MSALSRVIRERSYIDVPLLNHSYSKRYSSLSRFWRISIMRMMEFKGEGLFYFLKKDIHICDFLREIPKFNLIIKEYFLM